MSTATGHITNNNDPPSAAIPEATASVTATMTDNAPIGLMFTDADGGVFANPPVLTVPEDRTATYGVHLNTQPTVPVTVDITLDGVVRTERLLYIRPVRTVGTTRDGVEVWVTPETLTFTPENWNMDQRIRVTAGSDSNARDAEATLVHAISSADAGYNALPDIEVELTVIDDDVPGLYFSSDGISMIEGETARYAVRLSTQPTTMVTADIGITPDGGAVTKTTPETLTFTPENWNQDQQVTVTAGNDGDARNRVATLVHDISSTDIDYHALENDEMEVTVIDDDGPRLHLTSYEVSVDENGAATFATRLSVQPTAPVTIGITLAGVHEYSRRHIYGPLITTGITLDGVAIGFTPETLIFTPENWSVDQHVRVTAWDDIDLDNEAATFVLTISSTDADYDALENQEVGVTVVDDDVLPDGTVKGLLIVGPNPYVDVPYKITVDEGATATYPVGLGRLLTIPPTAPPTAPVTVTMRPVPNDGTITGITPETLTFIPESWSVAQRATFTVGSDDDIYDNVMAIRVTTSSDDDHYNDMGGRAEITVVDDDRPSLRLPWNTIFVDEGATTTYPVRLNVQPTAPVTVDIGITQNDGTIIEISPESLTFIPERWNVDQHVTVATYDDDDRYNEGVELVHDVSSADVNYSTLEDRGVGMVVVDHDRRKLLDMPHEISVNEGGTATYAVQLLQPPDVPITVSMSSTSDGGAVIGFTPETLTFMPETWNWDAHQHVIVTVGGDVDTRDEAATIRHTISSDHDRYNGLEDTLWVTVVDDDRPGLRLPQNGVSVNEGSTATYSMRLNVQPTGPVTVDIGITPDDDEVTGTTPEALVFTPDNWNVDRHVTVTTDSNDKRSDGRPILLVHDISSTDANYNALGDQEVKVAVIDNGRRNPLRVPSEISVNEGGTVTYAVNLKGSPNTPVTVTMSPAPDGGAMIGVTPKTLIFTSRNWHVNQHVTVTADSDDDRRSETATIMHAISSEDVEHRGLKDKEVMVNVIDSDRRSVLVIPDEISVNEGETAVYLMQLRVQPTAPVTIDIGITPDGGTVTGVTPGSLTFTTGNWNVEQPVTVTADHDDDAHDEAAVLVHTVSGGYASHFAQEDRLAVTVVDDPLTANAGDDITDAKEKTTVTLDGTGSIFDESDAAMIRYLWARKQGDDGAADWLQLVDAGQPQATFTVPNLAVGIELTFVLTVTNDRTGNSDADEVTVTISATNDPPKADAGESRDEQEGTEVTLDGSGSRDPEGEPLRYAWRLKSGGSSYVTMPSDLTTARVVVTLGVNIPDETELTFELRVTDPGDASHAADVVIKVRSTPFGEVLGHALSRFGRALGSSAVDTLGERFNNASRRAPGTVAVNADGTQLNLAGGRHQGAAHIAGSPPDTSTSDVAMPGPLFANHFDERLRAGSHRLPAEGRDLLMRSDFEIGLGGDNAPGPDQVGANLRGAEGSIDWAFWGRFDSRSFEATPTEAVALDGSVTVGYLGADARFGADGEVIVGLALARAGSDVAFMQDGLEGDISLGMLGFYPYGGWSPSEAVSLWGMLGAGSGEAELTTDEEHELPTDIGMMMLAGGGRGDLRPVGMVDLAVTGDVYLVNTTADAVADRALGRLETNVQRLRLGLEGSLQLPVSGASMLRPSIALSGRLDGGDAETGFGVEVNASIAYENAMGWMLDGRMRQLLTHTDDGIAETAFSAMLRYDPGGPGGPSIALTPAWGDMQSVAPAMWQGDAPMFGGLPGTGEVNGASASRARSLNAELQYGIPLRSWMIAPYGTLNMHGASDHERWGVRIEALALPRGNLSADLFGERPDGRRGAAMDPGVQATVRLLLD